MENFEFATTRQEVHTALRDMPFEYKLLDRTSVRVEALKSENARKRKAKGKVHLAAGAKKAKKAEASSSGKLRASDIFSASNL